MLTKTSILFRFLFLTATFGNLVPCARAADTWTEVKCPHFTVESNAGEKEARKVCDQFELFRATFKNSFPSLDVEPGTPIIIIAAKSEATFKELLPDMYEVKGHTHAIGIYQPGPTKIHVLLQMNVEGESPYHVLYHEYTHTLMHLNFGVLPLWLDEGLAEYLGNADIGNKEVRIGLVPRGHLYILEQNKLLPIETLFAVDHNSPYYNESNRTSVFYAESWALVHYLMLDPKARQDGLLTKFFGAYSKSGDQIASAKEAFGDLKKFGNALDDYARRRDFYNGIIKPPTDALDKNYAVRVLSPAESMALRGEFLVNHGRLKEAKPMLDDAEKQEPNLPAVHEALGMYAYRSMDMDATRQHMETAIRLGTQNFGPYYVAAIASVQRGGSLGQDGRAQAVQWAQKAVQINPSFAPGYDFLANLLRMSDETLPQAVNTEAKAVKLDPSTLRYAMNLTYMLMSAGRDKDALVLAQRIQKAARSDQEKSMAAQAVQTVNEQIAFKERLQKESAAQQESSTKSSTGQTASAPTPVPATAPSAAGSQPGKSATIVAIDRAPLVVDGSIAEAVCAGKTEIVITLGSSGAPRKYHASDLENVEIVEGPGKAAPEAGNCKAWKDRLVRVWFQRSSEKDFAGEITKLYFY